MKRSEILLGGVALGLYPAAAGAAGLSSPVSCAPLTAPQAGVPVAFLLSDGAVMIDFAGPWEVFQDVSIPGRAAPAFTPYTVAETTKPISVSGGAVLLPQYALPDAPAPKVVVVPAQAQATAEVKKWLRRTAQTADVIMSVCTGAFVLADAGLLDGLSVTTHHSAFATLAMQYPSLTVKRGARFVDNGHIATSAGLSAGIDLAMHVVARYYGNQAARDTAYYMEYLSTGWTNSNSNSVYAKPPAVPAGMAQCPVCWMTVDPKSAPSSTYAGKTYYFCMPSHKQAFDSAPARFLQTAT